MFKKRPFLGIFFDCCGAYSRIYRNEAGTAYEGRCPRCYNHVIVPIAPEGTRQRFFVAYPRHRVHFHSAT